MNVLKFKFPKINDVDLAFSTIKTNQKLLSEAKKRGFYNGSTKYNDMFSSLFFKGGSLDFKSELDETFISDAVSYFKALAKSFEPKHEEKEAVCALLLSELCN